MPNRSVVLANEVLRRHTWIPSLSAFWGLYGRPDLGDVERYDQLVGAPALQSVLYIAKKEIARRTDAAKPKATMKLEDGTEIEVDVKRRDRSTPLTNFIVKDPFSGTIHYHYLWPTKGWMRNRIDEGDMREYKKRGVRVLGEPPKTSGFSRLRSRFFEALRRVA